MCKRKSYFPCTMLAALCFSLAAVSANAGSIWQRDGQALSIPLPHLRGEAQPSHVLWLEHEQQLRQKQKNDLKQWRLSQIKPKLKSDQSID